MTFREDSTVSGFRVRLLGAALVVLGLALASQAAADSHEGGGSDEPTIKYRQSVMSIVGTNMGAIGDILKNQLALPGAVAVHANLMAETAQLIAPAFKKQVTTGATDAKPKIWQDRAKFEKAIASYEEAARGLAAAASGPDPAAIGPAMKKLGKSCGGCHKPFRKPKEESYKRK